MKGSSYPNVTKVLALLLVLVAIGTWWLNSRQKAIDATDLLRWDEISSQRNFDGERWQEVLNPATTGDYALTVDSLKSWVLTYPGDTEARLYLGRALALAGQQHEAQNLFFTIEKDEMRLQKERLDAQWYRALVGIQESQYDNACTLLKEILPQLNERREKQAQLLINKNCEGK